MKFPFVVLPRSAYDQLLAERDRCARLTKTIVRMKLAGGVLVRPTAAKREDGPRDAFLRAARAAIDADKHSARPGFAASQLTWAEREYDKGTDPNAIIERLRKWHNVKASEDDDDDDDDVIPIVVREA